MTWFNCTKRPAKLKDLLAQWLSLLRTLPRRMEWSKSLKKQEASLLFESKAQYLFEFDFKQCEKIFKFGSTQGPGISAYAFKT